MRLENSTPYGMGEEPYAVPTVVEISAVTAHTASTSRPCITFGQNVLAGTNLVFSFRKEITGRNRKTSASESYPGKFLLGIFLLVHRLKFSSSEIFRHFFNTSCQNLDAVRVLSLWFGHIGTVFTFTNSKALTTAWFVVNLYLQRDEV